MHTITKKDAARMLVRALRLIATGWVATAWLATGWLATGGLTGCTLDDGEPWGVVEAELSVIEPNVDESFELTAFEVDIEEVRLLALADGVIGDQSGGGCHGDHCHGADQEEAHEQEESANQLSEREIAHFELHEPITSHESIHLGESAVGERVDVERVSSEIHELVVEGMLTRDDEDIPTRIHLEHIALSGDVHVSFSPDSPAHQHLPIQLWWPEHWFEDIDVDQLETNDAGHIVISHDANHEAAEAISRHLTESRLRHVPHDVAH